MANLQFKFTVNPQKNDHAGNIITDDFVFAYICELAERLLKLPGAQLSGSKFFDSKINNSDWDIYLPEGTGILLLLTEFTVAFNSTVHVYQHVSSNYTHSIFAQKIVRIYILNRHIDIIFYDLKNQKAIENTHGFIKSQFEGYYNLLKGCRNTIFNHVGRGMVLFDNKETLMGAKYINLATKLYERESQY